MANNLSRSTLNQLFSNGERPTGDDFESAWKSFLHQDEDGLSYDGENLVVSSNTGIILGNPDGGPGSKAGTLRFNGTHVQYYDPVSNDFKDIAGEAGVFLPVGDGAAFNGNVGIGTGSTFPKHRLEIPLNDNTDAGQQVLLGKLVIHNGPAATSGAYIGNKAMATIPKGYALFQDSNGKTKINARNALNSQLSLAIDDNDKFVITKGGEIQLSPSNFITMNGNVTVGDVVIGRTMTITNNASAALVVRGAAQKTGGGLWADITSDRRVKKEIRPFNDGLQKLLLFDPVIYKFNGKGGTIDDGKDYIGLIAQDVKKIIPELTTSQFIKLSAKDTKESEVLGHDLSPLTFVFINAIKELNTRVEKLENVKKNEK